MAAYSVGGSQLGNTADRREALAVIARALKGNSQPNEGAFPLSEDVLYVYWTTEDGRHVTAEVSSFYVSITS